MGNLCSLPNISIVINTKEFTEDKQELNQKHDNPFDDISLNQTEPDRTFISIRQPIEV
jgi:hypothetical protein